MVKIAINGFGRIGRIFFRQAFGNPEIEIMAINDLGSVENLAYLLKHDTVYKNFDKEIKVEEGKLIVGEEEIKFLQERDPSKLPWGDLKIDVVLEATGVFSSYEKAKVHLDRGAKKVIITAPSKDEEGVNGGQTILVGINEGELESVNLISNGSCTTNSVAGVMSVLSENPGIEKAILNTIHSYTATQSLVDGPVRGTDFRRGRAGAANIVPTTTGAAKCVTKVVKNLEGNFDGMALRVPSISGSISDVTFISKKEISAEEINSILKNASKEKRWQGIIGVSEEPLVSSDILGQGYASIVDLPFTKVIGGNLVKILCWYDNEWGYVSTLVKEVLLIGEKLDNS